jgi:cytochrome c oxidase subunit 4
MSTTETSAAAEVEHDHAVHDEHGEHTDPLLDRSYILIAFILLVLTLFEVSTYFWDFGDFAIPMLLFLMVMKFAIVVAYFMHLRFDNRLFTYLFVGGLALAVSVYLVLLTTFQFWAVIVI